MYTIEHDHLIDQHYDETGQNVTLDRTYAIAGHTVRVRIRRNFYDVQSHALAEALSVETHHDGSSIRWVELVRSGPSHWHTSRRAVEDLVRLADELYGRALAVLGV